MRSRKIIHVDMDAFYASVEQRDNPHLRGKPVIVGGDPNSRGVVSTCSYEARKFGVKSAMACSTAFRLCPMGIFVKPRFEAYQEASSTVMNIFYEYTDIIEPLSLDEAFLDVTENKKNIVSATVIAKEILQRIKHETKLTASAGVSYNKFIAKVASDYKKPNGITVVTPENADYFIENLNIRKFYGVGKVTEKKMHSYGIKTGKDLKQFDRDKLVSVFGKSGSYYYDCANGIDSRPVGRRGSRKSYGKETTLKEDIDDKKLMIEILEGIAERLEPQLQKKSDKGHTVTLKVKYFDFQQVTRSITLPYPVDSSEIIMKHVKPLLENTEAGEVKVRLLGISVSNFINKAEIIKRHIQLLIPFPDYCHVTFNAETVEKL
ncbi:MAG: DNA polymerase IV [Desulfobacterales bacterium]|nr:DNA polymerase IV [Desulfobacterales bacterium]